MGNSDMSTTSMAADLARPISSPFLFVQLEPPEARPSLDAVIKQLAECTPFRFHNHPQSDKDTPPRLRQIEFQQLESAQKAYATIQHVQIPPSQDLSSATEPVFLSLSIHEDSALDRVPPEGTLLHVSELPASYCSAGALYELFKSFGPLYRIETGPRLGTARITYYNKASPKAAIEELHYSELDGTSIIVRTPSIHDQKDTFKSTLFPLQSRRAFSAGSLVNAGFSNEMSAGGVNESNRKTNNYSSGHRATCGVGSTPYGLSASAEPFNPGSRSGTCADVVTRSTDPQDQEPQQAPRAPLIIRSVSQPIKLADPCQLIIQNVPIDLNAQSLYMALRDKFSTSCPLETMTLVEATIASDASTGKSQGIALIRLHNKKQTDTALKVLNEGYLVGYESQAGLMPMRVKIFEPKGFIERGLELHHPNNGSPAPSEAVSEGATSSRQHATSPSAISSSTSSTKASLVRDKHSKHRKLLSIALDDLDENVPKLLFTDLSEKAKMLTLLVDKLPEAERKRCLLEEKYLQKRCEALKALYWDDDETNEYYATEKLHEHGGTETHTHEKGLSDTPILREPSKSGSGSESPTRLYGRQELLKLYTPHSPVHEKTEAMIRELSPTISTKPLLPANPVELREVSASPKAVAPSESGRLSKEEINLDTLVRFTVKGIIDLASSSDPPALLRGRDETTVKAVELFLDGIRGMKIAQQKQKIGEKVFKLFKFKAADMKNISKKTVALLDGEDLDALMHLTEEYPEILVHKAMFMGV